MYLYCMYMCICMHTHTNILKHAMEAEFILFYFSTMFSPIKSGSFGSCKFKFKVPPRSRSDETPLPGSQWAPSQLCPHMVEGVGISLDPLL